MGPIDYTSGSANPLAGVLQGFQLGQGVQDQILANKQREQAKLAQQQYQQDIASAMAKPTPQAFAALALKYPQQREAFKQSWDQLNADQQQGELRDASTLAAALHSGRPDVAISQIDARINAMKESKQDTTRLQFLRDQIEKDPTAAYGGVLRIVSGIPGGDKVLENLSKIGAEQRAQELQPTTVAKAEADAAKAGSEAQKSAIDAKYAEQNAIQEIQKRGWDIKAIQEDIGFKREANRIALMNAALGRETNDLKRQELSMQIQEKRQALDDKIRTKVADAEASAATLDNSLNTVERLKKNPRLDAVLGSLQGGAFFPNTIAEMANPRGDSDLANDAIALIDTLGSQAFLSQAANLKGMGALSNAEGEKLQAALANLNRKQSETQFRENLDEISRLLKKGRENISRRTGVPLGKPDTPAAPGARPPLESFEGVGRVGGQ
jgi:hypothetical protein